MAKLNKRQRKKAEKKRLQREIVATGKYTEKEVQKQNYSSLKSISQNEQKKQKRKQQKLNNRSKKVKFLQSKGFNPFDFTVKQIDSIKLKDIQNDNFNRNTYPDFFGLKGFDFERVYTLKNSERMYFAFRDFSGEKSFEQCLGEFSGMSGEQLLDKLYQIVELPPQYNKKLHIGSNGAAGDYKFICSTQPDIFDIHRDTYNKNRRKPKKSKEHTGQYRGFQVLKDEDSNRVSFHKMSARKLLQVINAIMWNVTEWERVAFYKSVYSAIERNIPELAAIMPTPTDWSR